MISAGALRHRIRLERQESSNDPVTGERLQSWITLADRRGHIKPVRGSELIPTSGETSQITAKIMLRYDATLSGLNPKDRAIDLAAGDIYDIDSVINVEEGDRVIELMCTERSR
ncbi:phage head closure protein [uncultured Paraglaciecola sp.]|uniref:phage head closure protein n=1 Tax=uncultured Paraglaciecola sp. TaxID=1765024 RepID=UPI00261B900C|nr:phage head closure protein [uncultured Paraglaciecola sp.]